MASRPSPSSPPSSASNADHPATKLTSLTSSNPHPQAEAAINNNGVINVDDKTPPSIDELHTADHIKKFMKYEADYSRWLTAKYFSKKTLYGGNIFDENMTIQDEVIKSSRWPCTRSYTDPVQSFEDLNFSCSPSTTTAETSPNLSNGNPVK